MPFKGVKYEPLPIFHESYKAKELQKMVASIFLDGEDKVDELNVIADEAYHQEVYNILNKATLEINDAFETKEDKVILSDSWHQSYLEHKAMLDIMSARYVIIQEMLQETERRLANVSKNMDTFTSVTRALLLQALIQMMESNVKCQVMNKDYSKMDSVITWCENSYKKLTGATVSIELDNEEFLDENVYGGVIIISQNGQITINNTLKQRFANMRQRAGSIIRLYLFGAPAKRKFLI